MSDTYRAYFRLILRSRLVQLSLLIGTALAALGPSLPHSTGSLSMYMAWWYGLTTLGVMLVAIGVAQQDSRERVAELIGALPVSNGAWLVGRVAAAITVAASAAPFQVLAAALRGLALGGVPLAPWVYLSLALVAGATFAAAAATGFALGLTSRRPLVPIILALLIWLLLLRGTHSLAVEAGYASRWVMIFTLPMMDVQPIPVDWFPHGRLVFFSRIYHLGQAALVIAAALALWNQARPGGRGARAALVAALVGVMVAGAGLGGYAGIIAGRNRAEAAEQAALKAAAPADPAPGARVQRYDLALDLDLPRNRLSGRAEMTVAGGDAPASELVFVLRPGLQVSAADGAELLEQHGQFVRLRLPAPLGPGQTVFVGLSYAGAVMQWRPSDWGALGNLANHITPSGLLLTGNYGWYPMLGTAPLARVFPDQFSPGDRIEDGDDHAHNTVRTHPAAEFRLAVRGAGAMPLFSNLPAAGDGHFAGTATAVYLLGGPYELITAHGVEVLAPRDIAGTARDSTRLYARSFAVLDDLVPRQGGAPPRLIFLPESVDFMSREHFAMPMVTPGAVLRHFTSTGGQVRNTLTGTAPDFLPGSNLTDGDLLGLWWPAFSSGAGYPRLAYTQGPGGRQRTEAEVEAMVRRNPDARLLAEAPEEIALALLMADMHDFILVQSATRVLNEPTAPAARPTERLQQFWYQNSGGALQVLRELYALRAQGPLTAGDLDQAIERAGGDR